MITIRVLHKDKTNTQEFLTPSMAWEYFNSLQQKDVAIEYTDTTKRKQAEKRCEIGYGGTRKGTEILYHIEFDQQKEVPQ